MSWRLCARRLKEAKPNYRFEIVSEIDGHHDRLRWNIARWSRAEGVDIVTPAPVGMIARVEGFFGSLTPVGNDGGVPAKLRPAVDI